MGLPSTATERILICFRIIWHGIRITANLGNCRAANHQSSLVLLLLWIFFYNDSMFSMRVFRPVLSSIALCCLLIIAPIVTWAQAQSHSSSFDTAFLSGDPLRVIAEPLFYGEKSFIQRLSIKTQSSREPLALVLCGGSARAYAHIGVLKVLERAGIQPDFIVANSMGAIVGVLYAAGFSPDDIELLVRSLPPEHYLDIVFPARGGFIDMNRFIAMLDMLTGSMDLSETHIPIIITGEDLKSRRQIWFAEGRLSRILAGAIAMPAIFEPQPVGNYLIVDGGSATIVPLEPALRFTQSIVVSTAFYNRIMNFSNPLTVINRAFDIGKTRTGIEALANSNAFVIRNRVEELSYMQFSNPDQIIRIGEESADQALRSLDQQPGFIREVESGASIQEPIRTAMKRRLIATIGAIRAGVKPTMPLTFRLMPRLTLAPSFIHVPGSLQEFPHGGISLAASVWRMNTSLSYLAMLNPSGTRQWALDSAFDLNPFGSLVARFSARLWGTYDGTVLLAHLPSMYELSGSLQESGIIADHRTGVLFEGAYLASIGAASVSWETSARVFVEPVYGDSNQRAVQNSGAFVPWFSLDAGAFAESSATPAVAGGIEGSFWAGIKNDFFAPRLRAATKISLNDVPFQETEFDGFRCAGGRSQATALVITNAELTFAPRRLSLDLAESILIRNFELAPFIDMKWKADDTHPLTLEAWAAGLCLSLQASAFGLAPANVSALASISNSGVLTLQVRAGTLFPTGR